MHAHIYKSQRRPDTYVYLRERDGFQHLPDSLRERLGELVWVLELDITPDRRLARENSQQVIANLDRHGYHLQLPPGDAGPSVHIPTWHSRGDTQESRA